MIAVPKLLELDENFLDYHSRSQNRLICCHSLSSMFSRDKRDESCQVGRDVSRSLRFCLNSIAQTKHENKLFIYQQ